MKSRLAWSIWGLTVLAGAVSIPAWRGINPVTPDSCEYMRGALSLLSGKGFISMAGESQTLFPLGYPLAIALFTWFTRDPEQAGRLVSLVSSTLSVPLLYLLARRFVGVQFGLLAAALFALLPLRIVLSTMVLSKNLCLFLLLSAALAAIYSQGGRSICLLGTSALLYGAAYLARPEGSLGYALLVITVLFAFRDPKQAAARVLVLTFSFALLAAPYVLYLHEQTGKWQFSGKTTLMLNVARCSYKGMSRAQMLRLDPAGTEVVPARPRYGTADMITKWAVNEAKMLRRTCRISTAALFVFFPVGLAQLFKRHSREPVVLSVLALLLSPFAYLPVFLVEDRLLLVAVVAVLICGCAGLKWLGHRTMPLPADNIIERKFRVVTVLLITVYCLILLGPMALWLSRAPARPDREIGLWIANNVSQPGAIITNFPQVAFYAGRNQVYLPYEPLQRLLQYTRANGVNLLLAGPGDARNVHPSIDQFLRNLRETADLSVLKEWDGLLLVALKGAQL